MSEVSDAFRNAFCSGGGISAECGCGITHFARENTHYDWNVGEHANLLELEKAEPDKYIESADDSVDYLNVLGRTWVFGCPCDYGPRVEGLLWNHRENVAEFLLNESNTELVKDFRVHNTVDNAKLAIDRLSKQHVISDDAAERLKGGLGEAV